ncbi:MAG: Fic family protein, partial [Muribaculaceae bacterium]|nr:Fic family protein [Muribaculaceae bacterium]
MFVFRTYQLRRHISGHIENPIRQIQEVKNAIRVYDLYSELNPFSENDLLKAHSVMMEALADDAGIYRSGGVGVFGESGLIHMAPPPQRVPELMGDLFAWLKKSKDHLLIRSCVFHYEFEFIHPFSDGNGRTGRLWQSLILGSLHSLFEYLPVENMVYANQQEYYNAIAASTAKGQSGPFIDFMLDEILKALQNNLKEVPDKVPNKVPNKSELAILRLLTVNPRLTRIGLAENVGITDNGIKKIIAKMKASGWIERVGSNK